MAKEGASVTAYEQDINVYNVNKMMQTLPEAKNLAIRFINESFSSFHLVENHYDITIMLNVHMWIDKQMGEENTRNLMRAIACHSKKLYFQTAHVESGGMQRVGYLTSGDDIKQYLYNCGFNSVREIKRSTIHGGIRIMYEAYGNESE